MSWPPQKGGLWSVKISTSADFVQFEGALANGKVNCMFCIHDDKHQANGKVSLWFIIGGVRRGDIL